MIVKTEVVPGGYVWIEHDDSVTLDDRIYQLKTLAPGHASFALGWDIARRVCQTLWTLTGGAIAMNTTPSRLAHGDVVGLIERIVTGDGQQLENIDMSDDEWRATTENSEYMEVSLKVEDWLAMLRIAREHRVTRL